MQRKDFINPMNNFSEQRIRIIRFKRSFYQFASESNFALLIFYFNFINFAFNKS